VYGNIDFCGFLLQDSLSVTANSMVFCDNALLILYSDVELLLIILIGTCEQFFGLRLIIQNSQYSS